MNDDELTFEEKCIEKEMKVNFIKNYANLVADNIATHYKYYGNECHTPFKHIMNMSKDDYSLSKDDIKNINCLIQQHLKNKHNLKLLSNYEDEKIVLEELK